MGLEVRRETPSFAMTGVKRHHRVQSEAQVLVTES